MPSPTAVIGGVAAVYEPEADLHITNGYTGIRVYWATSETAAASLATTLTLVAGTYDYSYNKTDALATDWFESCLYSVANGEGPRSQRQPIGPPQSTRLLIRQGVGSLLRLMDGPYDIASVTDSDTCVITELIDPDASAFRFSNRFIRCSAGTAIGQTRRVRSADAAAAGYVPSTGTLNVNRATSPAWVAGDDVELWRAKGDEDTSAMVDAAMNDAAPLISYEDTFLLTIDDSVSEYYLPAGIGEMNTLAVDYAADTYPSKPDWRPVGFADWHTSGGNTILTVLRSSLGTSYYSAGDVVRVTYAAIPDRMDSDSDYWPIPLEWAVAETAMAFLDRLGTPSGGLETVVDAERAKGSIARKLNTYRALWMPAARMKTVVAR